MTHRFFLCPLRQLADGRAGEGRQCLGRASPRGPGVNGRPAKPLMRLQLFAANLQGAAPPEEIKNRCAALLEAVGEVPRNVESFLQQMEADLADQKDWGEHGGIVWNHKMEGIVSRVWDEEMERMWFFLGLGWKQQVCMQRKRETWLQYGDEIA